MYIHFVSNNCRGLVSATIARRESTVCFVIKNDLKTSAVQNRGSDFNVVYRELNFFDELSTSVSDLVLQYLSFVGLLLTVNLHMVIKVDGVSDPTYCEFQTGHHQYSGVTLQLRKTHIRNMIKEPQQCKSRGQIKPEHLL